MVAPSVLPFLWRYVRLGVLSTPPFLFRDGAKGDFPKMQITEIFDVVTADFRFEEWVQNRQEFVLLCQLGIAHR